MNSDGMIESVRIDEQYNLGLLGQRRFLHLDVWGASGRAEFLRAIPGVALVQVKPISSHYWVWLDPRYDRPTVIARIRESFEGK